MPAAVSRYENDLSKEKYGRQAVAAQQSINRGSSWLRKDQLNFRSKGSHGRITLSRRASEWHDEINYIGFVVGYILPSCCGTHSLPCKEQSCDRRCE